MPYRLLTLCVATTLLAACSQEAPPKVETLRPVRAMQVPAAGEGVEQSFPGRTQAADRSNLSFRINGPLIERAVQVGDSVSKGQVLARIDPRDYEVAVETADGDLDRARSQLAFAEGDYQRARRLQETDPGAISERVVDQNLQERNRLRGEVRAAEARRQAAMDELGYTYLGAPFDGIVVGTFVEQFEYVRAEQTVVRILDATEIEMVIYLPESLISQVQAVESIQVKMDAIPEQSFAARIKEIGVEASAVTRTYPVTLAVEQQEGLTILPGMAGEATINFTGIDESIKGYDIPMSALLTTVSSGDTLVWIVDPQSRTVHSRQVEIAKFTRDGVLVSSGVEAGEWVVTAGVHFLKEGQQVRLLNNGSENGKSKS